MWILIVILLLLAFGGLPAFGWHQYGYGPSGAVGLIVIVLIVLLVSGRL